MKRFFMASLVLFGLLGPELSRAQSTLPPPTTRVRLRTAHDGGMTGASAVQVAGHLYRIGADSLWLRVDSPDGPLLSIGRAGIRRMEISSGRERNPEKGALWGAGAGLGLGLLAIATLDECTVRTTGWSFDLCAGNEDFLILSNVVAGAAWGALIGLLVTSERWETVPQASLIPGEMDGGIGLAVGFRLPN